MIITEVTINSFRNYTDVSFKPSPYLNFITGGNGAGKTSLLEVIDIASRGKTFKGKKVTSAIAYNAEQSNVAIKYIDKYQDHNIIGIKINPSKTEHFINGEPIGSTAALGRNLPVVLISPDIIDLFKAGPEFRRLFLNWGLFHHYADFNTSLAKYEKAHKQLTSCITDFSKILRRGQNLTDEQSYALKGFLQQEIKLSQKLDSYSQEYVANLIPYIQEILAVLLPEKELAVNIKYYSGWTSGKDITDVIGNNLQKDLLSGRLSAGFNRRDLRITLVHNDNPVEDEFSRGQLKLLACSLKIAQGRYFTDTFKVKPIYVIDDVISELDFHHHKLLAGELVKDNCQAFLSYVDKQDIHIFSEFLQEWDEFYIQDGNILLHNHNGKPVVKEEFDLDKLIATYGDNSENLVVTEDNLSHIGDKFQSTQGAGATNFVHEQNFNSKEIEGIRTNYVLESNGIDESNLIKSRSIDVKQWDVLFWQLNTQFHKELPIYWWLYFKVSLIGMFNDVFLNYKKPILLLSNQNILFLVNSYIKIKNKKCTLANYVFELIVYAKFKLNPLFIDVYQDIRQDSVIWADTNVEDFFNKIDEELATTLDMFISAATKEIQKENIGVINGKANFHAKEIAEQLYAQVNAFIANKQDQLQDKSQKYLTTAEYKDLVEESLLRIDENSNSTSE